MEDLNNHCVAFCKEFHVEVLKSSRKVSCGVSTLCIQQPVALHAFC